jgi:SulP family sulfate permease
MTGSRHDANSELVGQGVANVIVPLVGGIPVTGAIARTATNFRAGARTPVSGLIHALTLLLVVLFLAPYARFIPLATLAAVLFVVAYNMGEWKYIPGIWRLGLPERSVWLITFALTVFADLVLAVEVGMALAALLYIYRIAQTTTVSRVNDDYIQRGRHHVLQGKHIPDYVTILRIHGPFLFGTTDALVDETHDLTPYGPIVILRLRNMTAIDSTGLHSIVALSKRLQQSGRTVLVCGLRRQPKEFLRAGEFVRVIGEDNILPHIEAALARAVAINGSAGGRSTSPR